MWTNRLPSSGKNAPLRKLLSVFTASAGMTLVATASLYSQTQPDVKFTISIKFNGTFNGAQPIGNLLLDSKGAVYGVTNSGGDSYGECVPGPGCGVLYKWLHGRFTAVHNFTGQNPSIFFPYSGLSSDAAGNLYGETNGGSSAGFGTVYRLDPQGNINVLHSFTEQEFWPNGGLIQDATGNLYGVTLGHCNPGVGCGEVFRINPAGSETVLYTFPAGGDEGSNPESGLVQDATGNLYGTTPFGGTHRSNGNGSSGAGVLFKLTPTGTETVLHDFTGGSDGAQPMGLVRDQQGNLYGYTSLGGNLAGCPEQGGCGVVYKYDTQGKFTVIYTFTGGADGALPVGVPLLIGNSIYGATLNGGYQATSLCSGGCGVAFKLDLNGTETVLHAFTGADGDGFQPSSGLVVDASGNFWGTTAVGGARSNTLQNCFIGCGVLYTLKLTNP